MSFSYLHKLVAYFVAGLGLLALSLGPHLDPIAQVLLALGFVLSFFAEPPLVNRPAWIRVWTGLVLAFFVLQVIRGLAGAPVLPLGLEYAGFLQISRLFNRRTARDYEYVAVLAFVHLVAATVLSTGLVYGLVFLGFVVGTPWMLAITHLRREIEGNYPPPDASTGRADVARVLASRRVIGGRFLVGTALLAVPLFLGTAALFLVFPRVGMGFLAFGPSEGRRVAGFGHNVALGGFGLIRDDPTVVLRVKVPGTGHPPPDRIELRLRGTSFDHYDGRTWTRSPSLPRPLPNRGDVFAIDRMPRPGDDRRLTVLLDQLEEPVVFLPTGTVAITVPPRIRSGREMSRRLVRAPGLDVRYLDADALGLLYTAWVARTPDDAEPRAPLDPAWRRAYLEVPPGYERIGATARRITDGAQTDEERARRVLAWLRTSGRFRYTLHQPDVGHRDPLHVFLFDARAGHCEYFSTAMAILLRELGIPTRNVTGFLGGHYNPYGRYYAIREGDAHSWLEAYIDGHWTVWDPTPATRDTLGPTEGFGSTLRELLDALRTQWSTHVVGYDLHTQMSALNRVLAWLSRLRGHHHRRDTRSLGPSPTGSRGRRHEPSAPGPWLAALLGVLALAAAATWWWRRRRRLALAAPRGTARDAVHLYRVLERALERRGRRRPPATTPLEHLEALEREGFAGTDVVREVTHAYLGARWGTTPLTAAEQVRLRAAIGRLTTAAPHPEATPPSSQIP